MCHSPDWTQCTDANSGHPYYWNIVTKEVTWEIPIEYEQFLEQVALTNPPTFRKWILCYTDDNAPYYFNEVTREISWEKPDDFTESSSSVLNSPSRSNSRQSNVGDSVSGKKCSFFYLFQKANEDKFQTDRKQ